VKRVGLASAMCSQKDRLALRDVLDHIRCHATGPGGGGGWGMKERDEAHRSRLLALDAAASTLGLQ